MAIPEIAHCYAMACKEKQYNTTMLDVQDGDVYAFMLDTIENNNERIKIFPLMFYLDDIVKTGLSTGHSLNLWLFVQCLHFLMPI